MPTSTLIGMLGGFERRVSMSSVNSWNPVLMPMMLLAITIGHARRAPALFVVVAKSGTRASMNCPSGTSATGESAAPSVGVMAHPPAAGANTRTLELGPTLEPARVARTRYCVPAVALNWQEPLKS